jgi:hypothetical protein
MRVFHFIYYMYVIFEFRPKQPCERKQCKLCNHAKTKIFKVEFRIELDSDHLAGQVVYDQISVNLKDALRRYPFRYQQFYICLRDIT